MELRAFLETVVPAGTIVVARRVERTNPETGAPYFTFAHRYVRLHADAPALVEALAADDHDVYFALAAYKQGFHRNAKGKKVIRVRENVATLKALWFDIDFKGAYPDAKAAIFALRAFSQATALPAPALLVGSGNGVHAYWPLDTAVPLERWQRLADALKEAAKEVGLAADLACTADACRVLRPPGTTNWKDPTNPKPVKLLYSSGRTYGYDELEAVLLPWVAARKPKAAPASPPASGTYDELTGGLVAREKAISRFDEIVKHCAVARLHAESHGSLPGADRISEPEWMAMLQLLKHCEDGELWVHPISDQHPGYTEAATARKWDQRLANSAGPTLCKTFESYRPAVCQKCPHNGFIKTPLQVGVENTASAEGLPTGWRATEKKTGVERLMIMDVGEGKTEKEWVRVLRYIPTNLRATRSIVGGRYDLQFDVEFQNSKPWSAHLPGAALGNPRKLTELMADCGLVLKEKETKSFIDLMATWLAKLQAARRVADVTEQLGWLIENEKIIGFSCGPTTFYTDGRTRNDVRAAREFTPVAKLYEPRGGLAPWKKVASFIAEQNNPAFTAILAAAFGSPLLRFTGLSGAILSIVSSASGVGKSSALKVSQAVWGSPTHGVNAVDDTAKSVAKKLGFLNNLPAYWDELRGRKTVEDFLVLAFQITQGKERARLDSSAALRETATWETMLVVASNDSIFDAMGRGTAGSDAGLVRTFEMVIEPFSHARNRAEIGLMFEQVNHNYGHAGRIYGQYLATHAEEVEQRMHEMFKRVAQAGKMAASERFWFAVVASLLVGAEIAAELDLVKIDMRSLAGYLMGNITRLRGRTDDVNTAMSATEVLAAFMQNYQDRALWVDKFPARRANTRGYLPDITGGSPRGDKLAYVVSRDEKLLRFPQAEFIRWLEFRQLPVYPTTKRLHNELGATMIRCRLGAATKWELPPQRCFEVSIAAYPSLAQIRAGDFSRPVDTPGSEPETEPED